MANAGRASPEEPEAAQAIDPPGEHVALHSEGAGKDLTAYLDDVVGLEKVGE
jgi:hypothetical protein